MSNDGCTPIPAELLEQIIVEGSGDVGQLCTWGLVSHSTLACSRQYLFKEVILDGRPDRTYDFLALISGPWTSLSAAVIRIHLFGRTPNLPTDSSAIIPSQVAANLPRLESLLLTSINREGDWVIEILLGICQSLKEVEVDYVWLPSGEYIKRFYALIPSLVDTVVLYGIKNITHSELSLFTSKFKLKILDSVTLSGPSKTWNGTDSSYGRNVKLEEFHLRLYPWAWSLDEKYRDFLSVFLTNCGRTIERLSINLEPAFFTQTGTAAPIEFFERLDLSSCSQIEKLHIGPLDLGDYGLPFEEYLEQAPTTFEFILRFFDAHAEMANGVKYLFLTFNLASNSQTEVDASIRRIQLFPWRDLISYIRERYRNVRKIVIRIGSYVSEQASLDCINEARAAGLRSFEDEGLLCFHCYLWYKFRVNGTHALPPGSLAPLHWRDIFSEL